MGALSQAHSNNLLDASLGTAVIVATVTPLKCRLMTAVGTAAAAGTELTTGGSYVAATGLSPATMAAAAAGSAASSVALTQTNMPAATITAIELWDSAGTPVRKWWGLLTASKTTNLGDTFTIAAGSLTATLS
ncbi:MAG: phage tail fiber protein [Rhodoglobus sp.]